MFDMPDMKAFGKAVIGLTYSYWPQDDVDILSTIRDEDIVDLTISQPEYHDLSSLQPCELIRSLRKHSLIVISRGRPLSSQARTCCAQVAGDSWSFC